jgi:protoporphyrinogen/coproporphyrinogen III oxidase
MGFESKDVKLPPGHGLLVPHPEGRRLLAVTFVHAKFPGRAPSGKFLLRCFLGGTRDPEIIGASNEEIVGVAREDLAAILGLRAEPLFYRLTRSPQAMAQYTVGHLERLRAIEARVEALLGLTLSGNAYSGIGISDCIRTGQAAAAQALAG